KYQRGANVPTGKTEFQFHEANFNLLSTSYEWLVVAGARAQFKGSATINGAGNYSFLLTAIDGQVPGGGGTDKFRLKVWDSGGVIYDNQIGASDTAAPSTVLGGGSIVIHSSPGGAAPVPPSRRGSRSPGFAEAQMAEASRLETAPPLVPADLATVNLVA